MSGFGINVTQLMLSSGWPAQKAEKSNEAGKDATSWVAGLTGLPEIIGIKEISANMTKFNDTMDALNCY
jgi:hypothetical protein